jgi:hypothetical protein
VLNYKASQDLIQFQLAVFELTYEASQELIQFQVAVFELICGLTL